MVENVAVIRKIMCQLYHVNEKNGSWHKILDAFTFCIKDPATSELKKLYAMRFASPVRELAMHHSKTNPYQLTNDIMASLYDELANHIVIGMRRGLFDNEPQVDKSLLAMLAADEFIEVNFGPYHNSIMTH